MNFDSYELAGVEGNWMLAFSILLLMALILAVCFLIGVLSQLTRSWRKVRFHLLLGATLSIIAGLCALVLIVAHLFSDDIRAGKTALSEQVEATYGVEIREEATAALLGNGHGIHSLKAGGPDQQIQERGEAEIILDGEPVTLTLTWWDNEWVLLTEGVGATRGEELPRVTTTTTDGNE